MATRRVEIEVDPDFNIHTSYHNDIFLLRTRVLVNGENTEIRSIREGPVLNFCHSGSTISTTLSSISNTISPTLVQYGVYHVNTFYYEQSPLFHVVFSSESYLKNFIFAIKEVTSVLEPQLQSLLSRNLKTESPQQLTVKVHLDLFLVSPSQKLAKGAEVHLVTAENCSTSATRWKHSKLFDFGPLYQEEAKPPTVMSQPKSQMDIVPGKAVTFSVQATGTELSYLWQWKQFGKKGEKDEWMNRSSEGSISQEMGTELKITRVKAYNAGYYRCVVSNLAGRATSLCALLTVAPELPDLMSELQDVNDWIPFGLYLGIKMPKLEAIKADYTTLGERRIQMLNEWQKKVTPTWSAVVQALVEIGMRRLASELAQKHGTPPPKLLDKDSFNQLESNPQQEEKATASKLHEKLQKHKGDLKRDHRKLMDVEERLRHSQESEAKESENTNKVMTRLETLCENVEKISEEKSNLERELKIKKRECELLCAMQEKDEVLNLVLQKKIDKKKEKIKELKEELKWKEWELQSAMQEVQTRQKELSQARKELRKQHLEVIKLQREKEELECSFSIEKEQVSKIVQILASDKEELQQQLSSMKEESELKSQKIEECNADITHLSGKIKALSSSLQEKEAAAAQLQSELEKREQVASTQLLGFIKLRTQIAELECKLQEAEEQKQQAELEREATVQEMNAKENLKAQLYAHFDEPLKIINHPKSLSNISPGTAVSFTTEATGTKPLSYQWQWKPAEEEDEWQPCDAEWCDGATLTIPSVQNSNEGSYCCVVSNCASTLTSKPAQLSVVDPPRVTSHPQDLKDVVPGNTVVLTAEATGTEPLSCQWWHWKLAVEGGGSGEWQPCPAEWSDGATLTVPSVQKSNEGLYCCVISNCAGDQASNPAELSVADPPRVTSHPEDLKDVVPGKPVMFTVQATGTQPLSYQWLHWKAAGEGGGRQPCPAEWSDGATLTVPSVQKSNEGLYCCVISNCAGNQASNPAKLSVADPPRITSHPQELKDAVPGKPVKFSVLATGTQPLSYQWWHWKLTGEGSGSGEWQQCPAEWCNGATLTVPSVQKSNEGLYCCVISNCAGDQASNPAELSVADPPRVTSHPEDLKDVVPGKPVMFTVQATGTQPLSYQWLHWKAAGEGGGRQPCPAEWSDGATLTVPSVQKSNEGLYCCVISNCAGNQASNPAELSVADPPRITSHPQELKDILPGKPVMFTAEATGTQPLSYQWLHWKLAGDGSGSGKWRPCRAEWYEGATLIIPGVRKSNEGSYCCVVSNCAGSQASNPAELSVADPPRVTTHPEDLKDVVPGKPVMFTAEATGTQPLSYQWLHWKAAGEGGGRQPCPAEWSDGATLTIPSVQKSNEGSYCCVISNCAGDQASSPAELSVAVPPRVTSQLKNAIGGKIVMFAIEAIGTNPLNYQWQFKPAEKEWQPCDAEWCNGATLTIPNTKKSNEGSYRCVVSNYVGNKTSNPAELCVTEPPRISSQLQEQLSLAEPPRIITHPQELKDAVSGNPVMFTAEATGTSLSYQWEWKPKKKWGRSGKWQSCDMESSDGATLTICKVEKSHTGSYRCVISNHIGSQTSNPANLSVAEPPKITSPAKLSAEPPRITTHPHDLKDAVREKPAKFTIQATGTEPLMYQWEWKPAVEEGGSEEWQSCDVKWCDGATILIPMQKSSEGSYRCVISNCAGSQTSNPAQLNKLELNYPVFVGNYDFDSRTDDELSFEKGDLLYIIRTDQGDRWFAQSIATGKDGYIPSTYVTKCKSLDAEDQFTKKIYLCDFVDCVKDMLDDDGYKLFEEYERVKEVGLDHTKEASLMADNMAKNRYANIFAYDHSRVKLSFMNGGEPGSGYINACYIPGYWMHRAYVATQGPLPTTFDDFWLMVWEQNTHTIVMLTHLVEKCKFKCHQYWPGMEPHIYGDIAVEMVSEKVMVKWTIREFKLIMSGKKVRVVRHFQFTSWPDFGVPESPTPFIDFVQTVRAQVKVQHGPIVVHCSAGVGRTGCFIALDFLLQHINDNDWIDIFGIVCVMRQHRNHMVQTEAQYRFIHKAMVEVIEHKLQQFL